MDHKPRTWVATGGGQARVGGTLARQDENCVDGRVMAALQAWPVGSCLNRIGGSRRGRCR
jgi:hypothetical protein